MKLLKTTEIKSPDEAKMAGVVLCAPLKEEIRHDK